MRVLEVKGLRAGYGQMEIVSNVTFDVGDREVVAVVGPNGSGKSTLLKAVFGLCRVFSGAVLFKGEDVTRLPPHKRSRLGMAYLPQTGNVFESLTVRENLMLAAHDLGEEEVGKRLEGVLSLFPELGGLMRRKVRTLSGGERQIVALSMSLLRNPSLVMLDEPTAALAPRLVKQALKRVVELRDEAGVSIVLVEQNALSALEVSDKALLMVSGTVKFWGSSRELLEDRELAKTYLGL
ncbi:MAG: ABC transporter ATP-binding protein [Thermofilum sp.]|nr:ABC transporter ATP-binding protein [Thermofilum sp.]MCC6065084.1 ABC transporter ATP-binding protein [Thermofilum sp.]